MNNIVAGIGLIASGWFLNRGADKYSADEEDYPPANPLRIIIGGPPHSGKSTLMNLLEDKFQEYGVSVELRDLDLASKTDLKGGFDINREKKKWNKELADEAAALFDEPSDGRVILGDSIGLVSQLNEIVSEPADVAILLVGGSYGDNDDEYRSQLSKWNRYYDTIDKPVLMVIRSSMNPNDDNYFDPADNYGVIVGLDRPTYQQREEEGKRKGERKISLENACLEGMVFEIAQAYDLRLTNPITPAHKENIKRVWPTIQSHRGSPKNPVFVNIENEYYKEKGWNAEYEAEKKNCGCGQDPCVTYGADYIPSNDPSYEDSVKEFEKLKSKIPSMEVRSALAYANAKNSAIERIAKDGGVETLEQRGRDSLDFREIGVWNLKDMLSKSYDEGYEKGVLKWKGYSQMREGMGAETFNAESKKLGIILKIDRDNKTGEVLAVLPSYAEGKKAMTYLFKEALKERAEDAEEQLMTFTEGKKEYEWYESRSKNKKHLDFYHPTGYDDVIALTEHGMVTLADFEKTFGAETFNAEEKCPMPDHEGKKCGKGLYSSRLSPRPSIGRTTRGMMICGDCAGLESYAKGLGEWVDRYPNRRHDAETFNADDEYEAVYDEMESKLRQRMEDGQRPSDIDLSSVVFEITNDAAGRSEHYSMLMSDGREMLRSWEEDDKEGWNILARPRNQRAESVSLDLRKVTDIIPLEEGEEDECDGCETPSSPAYFYSHGGFCKKCIERIDRENKEDENFNAKTAPPLESYTKDELISSMAGPQGSASYDEMVYDPVSQNRLSAESNE